MADILQISKKRNGQKRSFKFLLKGRYLPLSDRQEYDF